MNIIPVEQLQKYLPHRPPMIWIDAINWVEETRGSARVILKKTLPYWGMNGTCIVAPIEWMAQTAGYCAAARLYLGTPNSSNVFAKTFLVGIRDAHLTDLSALQEGTILETTVELIRELTPLSLVRGQVKLNGQLVAEATLKLYGTTATDTQHDLP